MKPETRSFYKQAVRRAVGEIVGRLDEALDLESLAGRAALSPFHFHRVFRGMMGETPLELHRRLRMERAAWSLLHLDDSVAAIAFEAGYDTHEAFTRAFQAHYSCSPSAFRQSNSQDRPGCVRPFQIEVAARSGIHFHPDGTETRVIHFIHEEPVMNVDIKEMPELRVATVRHVGPYYRISEAFDRLGKAAGEAGLFGPDTMMIALYHDDPETTPETDLRSDAAFTVPPEAELPEGLGEQRIPSGRYACATHVGPYEKLGDAWSRLMGQWLPESGYRFGDGVSYEIYRNDPTQVPKNELRTDMYIPLA